MSEIDEIKRLRNDYVCFLGEIVRGLDPFSCLPSRSVNHTSSDLNEMKISSLFIAKYSGFGLEAAQREIDDLRRKLENGN